jgi:DNA modification methylase
MIELINANALSIPLADESVHAVVTSPPYYALRDYRAGPQLSIPERECLGAGRDECAGDGIKS